MFYSKFTIEFYKSFKSQQSMKFGIPIEGNVGSGITYLVGENNFGFWLFQNAHCRWRL